MIEVLIVIAIVLVLVALLLPLLNAVKRSARTSEEITQFKNLAVAHSLYIADYDDSEPGSSVPIIAAKYAPASLVSVALDPFPEGWANIMRHGDDEPRTTYKDSFVTLKGSAGDQFFPAFRNSQNGGWLISASRHLEKYRDYVIFKKVKYQRLTFGGSVITRVFPVRTVNGNESVLMDRCFSDDEVIPDTP